MARPGRAGFLPKLPIGLTQHPDLSLAIQWIKGLILPPLFPGFPR